jgi:hypothetical protein
VYIFNYINKSEFCNMSVFRLYLSYCIVFCGTDKECNHILRVERICVPVLYWAWKKTIQIGLRLAAHTSLETHLWILRYVFYFKVLNKKIMNYVNENRSISESV